MDDAQSDHLKAYGLAFRMLERGGRAEWFLNYRGGSFLLPADAATTERVRLAGLHELLAQANPPALSEPC